MGPEGNQINEVIFSIVQKSGVVYKDGKFDSFYTPEPSFDIKEPDKELNPPPPGGFEFKGGCTLIFDLDTQKHHERFLLKLVLSLQMDEQ